MVTFDAAEKSVDECESTSWDNQSEILVDHIGFRILHAFKRLITIFFASKLS